MREGEFLDQELRSQQLLASWMGQIQNGSIIQAKDAINRISESFPQFLNNATKMFSQREKGSELKPGFKRGRRQR